MAAMRIDTAANSYRICLEESGITKQNVFCSLLVPIFSFLSLVSTSLNGRLTLFPTNYRSCLPVFTAILSWVLFTCRCLAKSPHLVLFWGWLVVRRLTPPPPPHPFCFVCVRLPTPLNTALKWRECATLMLIDQMLSIVESQRFSPSIFLSL